MTISRGVLAPLLAAASGPLEICGLLRGRCAAILQADAARNVAHDPQTSFEIDPRAHFAALRDARAGGMAVLGHYHSHPSSDPVPSARDAAAAAPDGTFWLILGGGRALLWRAGSRGAIMGRFDAVGLHVLD